jgi:hypothetical protein
MARPVVKRRIQRWWYLVSGDWGCGEVRMRGAVSAVRRGGGEGVFYRAGKVVGRRGGDRRQWSFTPHRF